MKANTLIGVAVLAIVACTLCLAETTLSNDVFSLGSIKIGVSTLSDVQSLLGKSYLTRNGKDDESPLELCYEAPPPHGHFYVIFVSGVMGGFSRVTEFVITRQRPKGNCSRLMSAELIDSSGNGVHLGQSRNEFMGKFPIKFTENGSDLSYEVQAKRAANKDELKNLQKEWPNEKRYTFDVSVNIQAHFENGVLTRYQVSKIESF
jgi:hypothetical protein